MTVDGVVLVHGGMHGSWAWDPIVPLLEAPAIAVDLPGRGRRPVELRSVTVDDCVSAVLEDADAAGFDRFVLVGHSLGGLTLTETGFRHPDRVAHLVYVGALIPSPDQSAGQLMTGADVEGDDGILPILPEDVARVLFGNDLDDEQWAHHWKGLVPDALGIMNGRVTGYPKGIPITYVSMLRDQPVPPALVEQMLPNLGDGVELRTIDAGHTVMVSQPHALATILNEVIADAD
jgi:pimeloyl-ACP methyl ester carboxylesterase